MKIREVANMLAKIRLVVEHLDRSTAAAFLFGRTQTIFDLPKIKTTY